MRTGEKVQTEYRIGNAGVSLIELIVVIAIMAVVMGMAGYGLSLAFSRDAQQCANLINDALKETKMLSMTKKGKYSVTFQAEGTGTSAVYIAQISNEENSADDKKVYLDGSNGKKIKAVEVNGSDVSVTPYIVKFDKTKGNVSSVSGNNIIEFKITPSRGTKNATVQLVPSTGKHMVGEFN